MAVTISNACIGCGVCIDTCPSAALELINDKAVVEELKCTECRICIDICPVSAITLPKIDSNKDQVTLDTIKSDQQNITNRNDSIVEGLTPDYQGVWIFIEQYNGKVATVCLELLGIGRKLADILGVELAGVLIGDDINHLSKTIYRYGADKVYTVNHRELKYYRTETYRKAFVKLVNQYKPEIVLFGATTTGRDLAGAIATDLLTGLTADCTELDIDTTKRLLLASRPAFGGNIMATILCEKKRPQMASVRPKVMPLPTPIDKDGILVEENIVIEEEDLLTKVIEYVKGTEEAIKLDEAEIIVAGGKGMNDMEGFQLIRKLAEVLGGSVGASRAAVEAGWISHKYQIGQTGVTVAPKIYFAIGISGAIQHTVGMTGAEVVVAINSNPNAPILKEATYGIVGNAHEIVPKLIQGFKEALQHN